METEKVILYSTHCPKCEVLKKKLDENNVVYMENNSVDEMLAKGIMQAPILEVGAKRMDFVEAVKWVNNLGGN